MAEEVHVTPKGTPRPPPAELPAGIRSISAVAGFWKNADIFVVGTGTSLKGFDFSRLDNQITVGLNGIIAFMAPTFHVFHDAERALATKDGVLYHDFAYQPWTTVVTTAANAAVMANNPSLKPERILTFVNRGPDIDVTGSELWVDCTVATAGIGLAWKLGAQRVYLLGIDCYRRPGACYFYEWDGNESKMIIESWHDDEFSHSREHRPNDMVRDMQSVASEFERRKAEGLHVPAVYNLSPLSRIRAFPKADLEAVLSWT